MLKEKAVADVLNQVRSDGIQGAFLIDREGLLLAKSTYDEEPEGSGDPSVSAALISYTWDTFERQEVLSGLYEMTLEFEKGIFVITRIANMLLVIRASPDTPLGLVRQKNTALANYLLVPLSIVSNLQFQSDIVD
uniref:Robl_LC7 domain-containing protein n=1 Tax=Syphacia muris TaxID=451379 RepID=A0A0N5ALD6_9BILA